ncbi:MAG: glycoside hydrolase family 15 protein, partial [Gemmatimonas sp.]
YLTENTRRQAMSNPISSSHAPGWPGIDARWTSAAKSAVGTALGDGSRVWFTCSHGILNEIYYPEIDTACLRDAGVLVTGPNGFFSEEKRDCTHAVESIVPGVPAIIMRNTCVDGNYEIQKRICTSPDYDAVLQHIRFTPHHGSLTDYRVTLLLSPHLGNHGSGNTGWIGTHKGEPILFASREPFVLAVACSAPMVNRTATFAGPEDAYQDVRANGMITRVYERAENGNIALACELDLSESNGECTIAISIASEAATAAIHARAALYDAYEINERRYVKGWREWQDALMPLDEPVALSKPHLYRASTAVMKTHMSMNCDGGAIASLSVPWGNTKGDGDLGGYHLVWPRDMVETAGGLLAAGAHHEMRSMLRFLAVTQERDGRWPQNMWLSGAAYWGGMQLDETAFPILLVDLARRENALVHGTLEQSWPMVRRAATFVVMHGPQTEQDRWEENNGYAPFSMAVAIAGLLCAAEIADLMAESEFASFLRDTADAWNDSIEHFTYARDTELARQHGVDGYYVRIGSAAFADIANPTAGTIQVKNRGGEQSDIDRAALISVDALAYVRFGLRSAHDPKIVNTLKVIDAMLKCETDTGPTWLRYNEDGYGEHEDGSAYDGTGVGRGWPLLAGERAHYEIAAGNIEGATHLASVMRAQANAGAMLPEQVWNAPDIPELELFNGEATGSAMPLVWAHSEYVKLLRSLHEGRVFDTPVQTVERYVNNSNTPRVCVWRFDARVAECVVGRDLRLDFEEPASVHWSVDGWTTTTDSLATQIRPGLWSVELPLAALEARATLKFTVFWVEEKRWVGEDFSVTLAAGSSR